MMDFTPVPDEDLELQVAVAKISKYATRESGDTFEMIERPHGGLSLVLADGQRSGRAAKAISNLVVRKAISLLAEGVRDGAVARAAHDYLRTHRTGKVSATLNIVSVDLNTRTVVLSRNSHCPAYVYMKGILQVLDEPSQPVGIHQWTKPVITEIPLAAGTCILVFTDGLLTAGTRRGLTLDPAQAFKEIAKENMDARAIVENLLERALELDEGRPYDDISILVMAILARQEHDLVRRVTVRFPL